MFGDPLDGLLFGGETLDYFRLAIGPKNIDHPAKSGITFSRHESGSVFGHLGNMHLRRAGSSRSHPQGVISCVSVSLIMRTARQKPKKNPPTQPGGLEVCL